VSRNPSVRPLTIEEIEATAQGYKEDLQRETNRKIRRHDSAGALASLEAIEYIDKFVYTLKLRAGSRLGLPARARPKETVSKARYLVEVIERKLAAASDATGKQK
jgi:hypothetical protein